MGSQVLNLFVIIAVGVILAMLVGHAQGTSSLFRGIESLWSTGVNGMLGQTSSTSGGSGSGSSYTPPQPTSVNAAIPQPYLVSA
jgi:hypothetical protein